jgi:hypothetical protein
MKRILLTVLASLILCSPSFGWGREGHETIAKIAENNLKPSAKKKIEKCLGDHSIVYFAKWMDDYRHTPEYAFTSVWHVASVDKNLKYVPNEKDGDALTGLNQAVEALQNWKELSDSAVAVNLKYIIHLVGDMHCPAHVYYQGRNQNFKVKFGGGYVKPVLETKVHSVWDQYAIQATRIMSVSEYAQELDRKSAKEKKAMVAGTPVDWLEDNAQRCLFQFDLAHPGDTLAQDFVNEAMPYLETQMLYAGLRLAALLNSLF